MTGTGSGGSRPAVVVGLAMVLGAVTRLMWIPLGSGTTRFTNPDSSSYVAFAQSLPGNFWSSTGGQHDVTLLRTPGYPLWLWAMSFGGEVSLTRVVVAQCLLGGVLNVWLVAVLARRLAGATAAGCAAVAMAVVPTSVSHSLLVGTETLFTTFLLLVLLALERLIAEKGRPAWRRPLGWAAAAGVLLGLSAVVRPAMLYSPLLMALVAWAALRGRRGMAAGAVLLLAATVPIGGWCLRNQQVTGTALFSTAQGQNLFDYGVAATLADREGWTLDNVNGPQRGRDLGVIAADLLALNAEEMDFDDPVALERDRTRIGWEQIRKHPGGYLLVATTSQVRTVVGPGHTLFEDLLGGDVSRPVHLLLFGGSALLLLLLYLGAAAGIRVLVTQRRWATLGVLLVPAAYYLLVSAGPQMYARFRVPVEPVLCVLLGVAVAALVERRSAGRGQAPRVRG